MQDGRVLVRVGDSIRSVRAVMGSAGQEIPTCGFDSTYGVAYYTPEVGFLVKKWTHRVESIY